MLVRWSELSSHGWWPGVNSLQPRSWFGGCVTRDHGGGAPCATCKSLAFLVTSWDVSCIARAGAGVEAGWWHEKTSFSSMRPSILAAVYGLNTTHHSPIETMTLGGCVFHSRTCLNNKQGLRVSSHGYPMDAGQDRSPCYKYWVRYRDDSVIVFPAHGSRINSP